MASKEQQDSDFTVVVAFEFHMKLNAVEFHILSVGTR